MYYRASNANIYIYMSVYIFECIKYMHLILWNTTALQLTQVPRSHALQNKT